MKNHSNPTEMLARFKQQAAQAQDAKDWATALDIYAQGLAMENLPVIDKIAIHEGRAACFRELGNLSAEAEELREANRLHQQHAGKLLEENRQRNAELAVINSIQDGLAARLDVLAIFELVGMQISEIFSGHNVGLYTYDPDTDLGKAMYVLEKGKRHYPPPFRPGPIGRRAIETSKPLMISSRKEYEEIGAITVEGTEPSQSGIYAPLVVNGRMIGALNIENSDQEYAFAETDLRLLATVANAVTVALENARLFDETQRLLKETEQRNAELAIVNAVQQALASELNIRSIYAAVGEKLREFFDVQTISIYSANKKNRIITAEYTYEKGQLFDPLDLPFNSLYETIVDQNASLIFNGDFPQYAAQFKDYQVPQGELPKSGIVVPIPHSKDENRVVFLSLQDMDGERFFSEHDVHFLETLASSMSIALENARLFEETQRLLKESRQRSSELQIINNVQAGLVARLDMQEIYDLVGDQLKEIFDAQVVVINRFDMENRLTHYQYAVEKGQRLSIEPQPFNPIIEGFIENKRTFLVNQGFADLMDSAGAPAVVAGEVPLSILAVPLLDKGQVVGGISLQNVSKEHAFKPSDVQLLETLAASLSVALETARLFAETQRLLKETEQRNAELAIINSVQAALAAKLDLQGIYDAVGDKIREIFNADTTFIAFHDDEKKQVITPYYVDRSMRVSASSRPYGRGIGIYENIIESGQPVLLNSIEEAAQVGSFRVASPGSVYDLNESFLGVPIFRNGQAIGATSVQSYQQFAFDQNDVRLLTTLTNSMSVALENARLFDETQRLLKETEQRAGELEIINSVLAELASRLDIQAIYDLVGDKICEITGSEIVVIQSWDKTTKMTRFDYAREKGVRSEIIERQMTPLNWLVIPELENGKTIVWNDGMEARLKQFNHSLPFGEMPLSVIIVPFKTGDRINTSISLQSTQQENAFDQTTIRLVETLAGSMGIALKNARLFDEIQRLLKETEQRAGELAIINSIQQGLASEMDFQGIVDLVGDRLQEVLQIGNVSIIWVDYERIMAVPLYVSIDGARVKQEPWKPGKAGQAMLKNRQPIVWQTAAQANEMGLWTREGDKEALSGLYMPIIGSDKVIGAIRLEHYVQEYAFDDSAVRLINTIASSMGVALENARLFDEAQRLLSETTQRAAELAAINRVSNELVAEPNLEGLIQVVGEQLRQIFNADIAYVALLDQAANQIHFPYQYGEQFSTLQLGEGLTSKIIESGEPLLINQDVELRRAALGATPVGRRARSYLGVPIILGKQPIGVVSVQSTQTEGLYSEDDVRLLSTIAANVSTAIRNANLFEEINNQKKYYEMIIANSPAAIVLLDEEVTVTGWNPAAERLFGYTQEEAIGHNIDSLVAKRSDIYADAAAASRRGVQEGGVHLITKRTRKDSSVVDVELMALPVIVDGRQTGYIAIYHDITELQRARQEAIEANQAKSAFLANMSHELRTPLNAIIGFTRIVRRKGDLLLPQKQLDNLDKVLVSSDHLLNLINTVLDIAKIEAGRMDVQVGNFQIKPLIELVENTTQPLVRQGKVKLRMDIQENIPVLQTDQDKLKQILLNLLSNAAKFTHEGSITVSAGAEAERLVISVTDTGIGISPEALDRVFEEFQQADTSTTREYGGTGLGLSISRSLAQLLGGDLKADSQEGVGTTFTLTILLVYSAKQTQRVETHSTHASEQPDKPCDDLVLVIDDHLEAIELIREILTDAGYRVIGVQDGMQGLKLAREIQPMAITLDIMMPSKDGWQVLHDLKSDPLTRDIPVIMATILDKKVMGYQLGADDYLVKPMNADELLASLGRLTGKQPLSQVLVVDDDPNVVDMIRQMLEDSAYQIESAADGLQALRAIQAAPPDVILLDLLMPNLDGFGLIEKLRQRPETRRLPIIILTAKSLTKQETAALNESIYTIMQKQGLQGNALLQQIEGAMIKAQ